MKRSSFILTSFCVVSLSFLMTACGGSSSNNNSGGTKSTPSVTTSSMPAGNVGIAYSATLEASGGTAPYKWSLKSGTLPTGISLSADGTVSGTPSAAGTAGPLVFEVTDANSDSANSGSLSLKVDSVVQVTTTTLPSGTQGTAYNVSLAATGGSGVYTWSLKSGSLPSGLSLNSSTGAITGTPTTANVFNGLVFQATDADTATGISAPLSMQVYNTTGCSSGAESNLGSQPYAFLIKGFGTTSTYLSPMTLMGSFTPDGNGGITGGEEDMNSPSGAQSALSIVPSSSSYSLGPDNNGCLILTTSAGTINLHFSVSTPNGSNAFTQGHIMLDNSSGTAARGSGILRLQDSSALATGLSGMYAFLFTGTDGGSGNFGVAGSFTAGGGNFTNLALDADDAGTLITNLTGGNGTYSSTDTYGRGTASFTATNGGYNYNLGTVYYVINSTEVLFASSDPLATNPICGGRAFATDSTLFTASYLQNNYVAHGTGLTAGDVPEVVLMTVSFDGVNTGSGSVTQDQGGTVRTWPANVNYSVDAGTGRIAFTGSFIAPVGYVVAGVDGISAVLVANDYPATATTLEVQQASSVPTAGTYSIGSDVDADYLTANQVGTFILSSASFSGTENVSNPVSPFLVENQYVSSSLSIATNGTGTFWGNPALSTGSVIYFINEGGGTNTHPAIISVTK